VKAWLRPLAAAALVTGGLGPLAHADDPRTGGWILTRTSARATPVEGHLWAYGTSEESAVVMFAFSGRGAARRVDYRFTTTTAQWGVDGWAQVNAGGVGTPPCAAACQVPPVNRAGLWVTSAGRALLSTVYVATYDVTGTELEITSPGWTVRPWHPSWHGLTATDPGEGVSAAHTFVGTYRGGTVAGGRYGSFVSTALPCDERGSGEGLLTGAGRTWQMYCGGGPDDGAPGPVRWHVEADTQGKSTFCYVIIVVDLPRG
jgi:hypothetical protein